MVVSPILAPIPKFAVIRGEGGLEFGGWGDTESHKTAVRVFIEFAVAKVYDLECIAHEEHLWAVFQARYKDAGRIDVQREVCG